MATYADIIIGNVAAARARHKLSQKALAERMEALGFGWRQQTVAAVEKGGRSLAADEILGLAYALETSAGNLMTPADDAQVEWPSGQAIDTASVGHSVNYGFNDGVIKWVANKPEAVERVQEPGKAPAAWRPIVEELAAISDRMAKNDRLLEELASTQEAVNAQTEKVAALSAKVAALPARIHPV